MNIFETAIEGVMVVETEGFRDDRGQFYRAFCDRDLAPVLQGRTICQANVSRTAFPGTIRGLHFQYPPQAEMKLIRCLQGRIWDVSVDLRRDSPTFLQWYGLELGEDPKTMVIIPEGCAHGFQVLQANSDLLYLHTAPYTPALEGGVRYDDPKLGIPWPLAPTDLSQRDCSHSLLTDTFGGIGEIKGGIAP
jgi:dTDP-4-dehydrorhamnose 3,5-epimerase